MLALLVLSAPAQGASLFYVRGGGDGHGIGMSQYGAYGYAQHGKGFRWILRHYYQGTSIGTAGPNRIVRVLLPTSSAVFSGASRAGTAPLDPSKSYSVTVRADGSLGLVGPRGKPFGHFAAPLSVTGPGPLQVAGLGSYRGALEYRPGGGGMQVVEAVGLEDYVRGVISREIPASWPPEALKVQAVAARTYAITSNKGGGTFDQYADTRSQMYGGVAAETAATNAAVAGTRGQIVTYHGNPAVTYFFNSSGGHTENIEVVWPGATPEPWLRGVNDPYDNAAGDPYHAWGRDMTGSDAAGRLGGLVKGRFVGIQVTKHGSSPRVITADVVGSGGRSTVSGTQLQSTFGLLTTNAKFTTISTSVGSIPVDTSPKLPAPTTGGPLDTRALSALTPVVRSLAAGAAPGLVGRVFPGKPGDRFTVQRQGGGSWHTVANAGLGAGGRFAVQPGFGGTYRISYHGLNGPGTTLK